MKFARYLQDTQTPEWKRAYIDYRGLKKRITAIRKAHEGLAESPDDSQHAEPSRPSDVFEPDQDNTPRVSGDTSSSSAVRDQTIIPAAIHASFQPPTKPSASASVDASGHPVHTYGQGRRGSARGRRPSFVQAMSFRRLQPSLSSRLGSGQSRAINPLSALPLHDLLALLSPQEMAFFTTLDAQLEKIESFYLAREKEMRVRTKLLHEQLEELSDHKKLVQASNLQAAHPKIPLSWFSASVAKFKNMLKPNLNWDSVSKKFQRTETKSVDYSTRRHSVVSEPGEMESDKDGHGSDETADQNPPKRKVLSSDPEDYLYAKKKLKKAVLEHYRGLEMLYNYRILNTTGFRKALKKFEKVAKIPAQRQYMTERVEKSAFASDNTVRTMMKEMQDLYATVFVRGDKKRAMARLRAGSHVKSHHFSVFRSGILLGLAVPAVVSGLHQSFLQSTRDAIPGWDGLLFVYGILLVPVLFAILVGVNLLVWSRSRINYVFIFELDTRTRLDYREYFETPSILLAGLCYAFWLSFLQIGAPSISPTVWPLVWLGFAGLIMTDPLPFLFKPSRYWLIKNVGKLLISGTRRVEFTDFWMGDQFCSLVFTLSNLYLFACVYADGFKSDWQKCGSSSPRWPVAFVLASLPSLVRLVQSIRRYVDSRLITHLINGGKYGSGIISYFFFYLWRHQGSGRGATFALWCLFNTVYSIYATSWDLLMDWSFLRIHSRHPLLRPELVYSDHIPLYYFAIITNILIRFIWVLYIPNHGSSIWLRTFIAGILEMLRRWQWNFYRLENEHLGNMDQYRVTREVPLPYSFDDSYTSREDGDEDGDEDDIPRR